MPQLSKKLRRLTGAVLAGVVTTAAITEGLALWTDIEVTVGTAGHERIGFDIPDVFELTDRVGVCDVYRTGGAERAVYTTGPAFLYLEHQWSRWVTSENLPIPAWSPITQFPENDTIVVDARGWPCLAFRSRYTINNPQGMGDITDVHAGAVIKVLPSAFSVDNRFATVLPLQPIWSGLLLNTLIFGVAWFALLSIPGAIRHVVRMRLGRCPSCGYDLRGHAPGPHSPSERAWAARGCPECGWRELRGSTALRN